MILSLLTKWSILTEQNRWNRLPRWVKFSNISRNKLICNDHLVFPFNFLHQNFFQKYVVRSIKNFIEIRRDWTLGNFSTIFFWEVEKKKTFNLTSHLSCIIWIQRFLKSWLKIYIETCHQNQHWWLNHSIQLI